MSKAKRPSFLVRLLMIFVTVLVAFVAFTAAKNQGWFSVIGINSQSSDSQVIQAIERTQEVSMLALGVQGIREEEQNAEVGGWGIPLTGERVFLQYNFTAKLGIDGSQVEVEETAPDTYSVTLPEFTFIGYDQPTFKVAVEDGSVLSWVTPDIDQVEMVNDILNDDARDEYIAQHTDVLKEQAQVFFDNLIKGVVPEAKVTYEFS